VRAISHPPSRPLVNIDFDIEGFASFDPRVARFFAGS